MALCRRASSSASVDNNRIKGAPILSSSRARSSNSSRSVICSSRMHLTQVAAICSPERIRQLAATNLQPRSHRSPLSRLPFRAMHSGLLLTNHLGSNSKQALALVLICSPPMRRGPSLRRRGITCLRSSELLRATTRSPPSGPSKLNLSTACSKIRDSGNRTSSRIPHSTSRSKRC